MVYCHSCDKNISKKFIKRHNKSKTHIYFYNNYVINKFYIGDVLYKNFENIIKDYINDYNNKFFSFTIKIDFQLNDNIYSIAVDNVDGEIPLYKFNKDEWIYFKYCQSKKVMDYILYIASSKDINLSIINNVIITIFLKYKTMKRNYLLSQPRKILESKILRHIHNLDFAEKLSKYYFLSKKYYLL